MTRSSVFFALLGSLWLAGCSFGVDGNGERTHESREVAAFSRIRSDCELDIAVTQAEARSVLVSIDSNLQHLVKTRVEDDTLYVDLSEDVDRTVAGPHVLITAPELLAAKLAGSGNLTLAFDQPTQPFDLYLTGSGDVRFEGTTAAVSAHLSGSGDIRLEGETSDADLTLSGSGSIRAKNLTASSASIDLSGSGDISASVDDSVKVSLSGSGRIDLYGGASIDERHDSGSGDIAEH